MSYFINTFIIKYFGLIFFQRKVLYIDFLSLKKKKKKKYFFFFKSNNEIIFIYLFYYIIFYFNIGI